MKFMFPTLGALLLGAASTAIAAPTPASSQVAVTNTSTTTNLPAGDWVDEEYEDTDPDFIFDDTWDAAGEEEVLDWVDVDGDVASEGSGNVTLASRVSAAKKAKVPRRMVVYANNWLGATTFPSAAQIAGYTHFNLAFWMTKGPVDNGLSWAQMPAATRAKVKKSLTAKGAKLMVSAFGATEEPSTQGKDPVKTARSLAAYVKKYGLDGVDVDFEDLTGFNSGSGKAEKWVIALTRELRKRLGPKKIISHAPLAPWFQTNKRRGGGGYMKVHKEVGKLINFYNIQYYNQGAGVYTDCKSLVVKSNANVPGTAVMQIIKAGVPGSKIVVGKPAGKTDATNGRIAAKRLGQCLKKYRGKNGFGGSAMVWQWAHAGRKWVQTVLKA